MLGWMTTKPFHSPKPITPLKKRGAALPDALVVELAQIAREEWNQTLSHEEAREFGEWLVAVYRDLLER